MSKLDDKYPLNTAVELFLAWIAICLTGILIFTILYYVAPR